MSDDLILTNHRSAGHLLARGADPRPRDGRDPGQEHRLLRRQERQPAHLRRKSSASSSTSTIVGGELSLVDRRRRSRCRCRRATASPPSSSATARRREGIFHESVNLAAVWELPILYVCENNQWQACVHRRETMLTDHISNVGQPRTASNRAPSTATTSMPSPRPRAKRWRTSARIASRTSSRRTPIALRGHMEPDDQAYVDPAELAQWKRAIRSRRSRAHARRERQHHARRARRACRRA